MLKKTETRLFSFVHVLLKLDVFMNYSDLLNFHLLKHRKMAHL